MQGLAKKGRFVNVLVKVLNPGSVHNKQQETVIMEEENTFS